MQTEQAQKWAHRQPPGGGRLARLWRAGLAAVVLAGMAGCGESSLEEAYTEIVDCDEIVGEVAQQCASLEQKEEIYKRRDKNCDQRHDGDFVEGPFLGDGPAGRQPCCYIRRKPPENDFCIASAPEAPFSPRRRTP